MIKFIHTADIHLGLQFNNVSFHKDKAMARRRELWSTFERIVKKSIEDNVDFLFIAGDLYEERYFTLGDMKKVRDILATCPHVNVIISAGNHDFIDQNSLYNKVQWTPNVTIFKSDGLDSKEFEELNTVVYGYSWDKIELKENMILENIENTEDMNRILIIHGDIGANSNYLPLDLNVLKDLNMDYIALGHIHKPNLFNNKIAYSGSPEPLDFGESGDRGIILGTINNGVTKIELVPFSKRSFLKVDMHLNNEMGYLDIINKIKEISIGSLDRDFYRVHLQGYIDNDLNLSGLEDDLESSFYHIEIIDNTELDFDLEALEKANKDNIIGQFIHAMKSKGLENQIIKDSLYYGLSALLKGRVV
ncbi:MAG: DNA repair exonuclease [Tissierellia bacterium]|nr:DNA repair exonuclease [Tissierellia bacterium]